MADSGTTEGYEEVTLADLVRTIYRRKLVLLAVFMAALVVGVSFTVFTPPTYEAQSTLIPLEHQDIIKNWLGSRQAADQVLEEMGDELLIGLFPGQWDESADAWKDAPPSSVKAASVLLGAVDVKAASVSSVFIQGERLVTVTVTMQDPALARDVANAYVAGLETLRPIFEDITQDAAFVQYYDGSNAEEARARAEVTAKERQYWLVLDYAVVPESQASPNVVLNVALAVVLGLLGGVFAVFFVEWMSRFRAESRSVSPPSDKPDARRRFSYRGK